jgi:hypothetical protein
MVLTRVLKFSMSSDGNQAALPEVSWQTCFWILVTLALNTMAQPCGKVCNSDSRYSMYMLSFPFICIADMLSIFSRVGYIRSGPGTFYPCMCPTCHGREIRNSRRSSEFLENSLVTRAVLPLTSNATSCETCFLSRDSLDAILQL